MQLYRNAVYGDEINEWNSPHGRYTKPTELKIDYGTILRLRYSSNYYHDLWFDANLGSILYRKITNNVSSGWITILDNKNYTTYLNNTYVKKSGGEMTGHLSFTQSDPKIFGNGSYITLQPNSTDGTQMLIFDGVYKSVRPAGSNLTNLGLSNVRWNNVYSVLGNFSGQITSSVADGTAPFVVASKTLVSNLNADLLDGVDIKKIIHYNGDDGNTENLMGNRIIRVVGNLETGNNIYPYGDILQWSSRGHFYSPSTENAGNFYHQLYSTTLSKLYYRSKFSSNAWAAWKQIAFTDSDITGNAATATYATSAGNADMVDGYNIATGGNIYLSHRSVTDTTNATWYVKVKFAQSWNSSLHKIRAVASYNNVSGWLELSADSRSQEERIGNYIAKCSKYNGNNITGFYWGQDTDYKQVLYLRMSAYSSASVTVHTTLSITSMEVVDAESVPDLTSVDSGQIYTNYRINGKITRAEALLYPRTLWGQSFDGSGNVSGNLTGVGNITGTAAVTIKSTNGVLTLGTIGNNNINILYNDDLTKGICSDGACFRPYSTANGLLDLGSTFARWKGIYGQTLDLTGAIKLNNNTGIYWRNTDGAEAAFLHLNTNNDFHLGNSDYGSYLSGKFVGLRYGASKTVGLALTEGGNVGINTTTPAYRLDVDGTFHASGDATIGGTFDVTKSIYSGSSLFSGGKKAWNDGVTGCFVGNGTVGMCAPNPTVQFFYNNATSYTSQIREISGGVLSVNNVKHQSGNVLPSADGVGTLGSASAKWSNAYINTVRATKLFIGDAEIYCDAEGVLRTNASFASDKTVSSLGVGSDDEGNIGGVIDLTNVVTSIVPSMDGPNLGTAASRWNVLYANSMNITDSVVFATSSSVIAYGTFKAASIDGDLIPAVDGEYNIGSPSMGWNEIYANGVNASVITENGLRVATKKFVEDNYVTIAGQQTITGLKYFSQVPAIDLGTSKLLLATMNDVPSITPLQDSGTEIARIDLGGKQVFLYAPNVNIPSLEGYATTSFVEDAIKDLSLGTASKKDWTGTAATDQSSLVTEDWVKAKIDNLNIPDVSGFATTDDLDDYFPLLGGKTITGKVTISSSGSLEVQGNVYVGGTLYNGLNTNDPYAAQSWVDEFVTQELNTFNEEHLGTAASKGFTTSVTNGSTDLVTSGAVYTSINSLGSSISGLNGEISAMKTLVNDHQGKLQNLTSTTGLASGYIKQLKADTLDLGGSTVATMDDLDGYLPLSGGTMTGTLTMCTTGTGNYNHGIRINRVKTSDWALILIGKSGLATSGTGTSTAGDGAWLIGTPASSNSLIFNLNSASETVGLCLKGHGNTDMKWNNNTVWHAGNDGSGSGLDADKVDGVHLEWAGSQAASDTVWLAGWTNDGTKLKAVSQSNLSVNYANSANYANSTNYATSAGSLTSETGGSWISARDNVAIKQTKTNAISMSYNPLIGFTTQNGFWSLGSCGGETLYFSYDTDTDYNSNTNNSVTILIPNKTGTFALTSDIPTKTSDLTNDSGFITSSAIPSLTNYAKLSSTNSFTAKQSFTDEIEVSKTDLKAPLTVQGTRNTAFVKFTSGNSNLGYLGFSAVNTPAWMTNDATEYIPLASKSDLNGYAQKDTTLAGYGITDGMRFENHGNGYVAATFMNETLSKIAVDYYIECWDSDGWWNWKAGKWITVGGTSSHFVKGDGSLDSTDYLSKDGGTISGSLTVTGQINPAMTLSFQRNDANYIWANGGSSSYLLFGVAGVGTSSFANASLRIRPTGNVEISKNLTVSGYITAVNDNFEVNANGAFWKSDRRAKKDIYNPVKSGLLQDPTGYIRKFTWKDTNKPSYGYIAQELLNVIPEAVNYNEVTNMYAVNYDVAHSAAIAQLVIKVKELEEEILRLKQLIN